ncbi:DNA polymerase III subunit epsilon [Azospirillum griseum]|uniref:DNA polymerase III subunit epsilon n=1 Tax=Azospirillum griseum TaxID=2496639 RepID=A0A3S0I251_9PROT|nr:DNA polymerase III subunit epsilon [Azospirillum griseum]RTR21503.1 DNA polymerase III subunit epsilon [Azospirillum griseum]
MQGGAWRGAVMGLAVATAALTFLAVERATANADNPTAYAVDMTVIGLGLLALWVAFSRITRHARDLGRLRDALAGGRIRGSDAAWLNDRRDEIGQIAHLIGSAGPRPEWGAPARSDKSLSAVLTMTDEPFLILGETGRIEQLNPAAARLLDGVVAVGDDSGQALSAADLSRAVERARGAGEAVTAVLRRADGVELSARVADLGLNGGMVITFPQRGQGGALGVAARRAVPLRAAGHPLPLGNDEPLAATPLVSLWVATAGSCPGEGAVIAVGTMRLVGARVFRTVSLSVLIDPADTISPEATARHGIDIIQVAGQRPFAAAWPTLVEALHHCVVVGVGVDAALAALTRACAQSGLPPLSLPSLDVGRIASVLNPSMARASLPDIAAAFGIHSDGDERDGAFAAVRLQAELTAALLPRLADQGVITLRQARDLIGGVADTDGDSSASA